ncbi:MAG: bicarbonate-binding protein, partial [Spirulina sp. DLM2.Bin59]
MANFSRRRFLFTTGAAAATTLWLNSCASRTDGGGGASNIETVAPLDIAPEDAPEITTAKLGFIALTDSAPLIIAK